MAAETGFIIDGVRHEIPTLDTFTMDEAQVMYDYCGLTIEDFVPVIADGDDADEAVVADISQKLKNPGFLRALMHVSYQRANPKLSAAKVKSAINNAELLSNYDAYLEYGLEQLEEEQQDEADAIPPASATGHERSWNESSVVNETSPAPSGPPTGDASKNDSEEQDAPPTPTTTSGSDTSSDSPPISLVASNRAT